MSGSVDAGDYGDEKSHREIGLAPESTMKDARRSIPAVETMYNEPPQKPKRSEGNFLVRIVNHFMKSKLWTVCIFILVVEMCERLTYYTFAGSQRNHLQQIGYSNAQATAMNAAFSILCYITPLFGGWMADSYLGRYYTIFFFGVIYVIGVVLAAVSAYPTIESTGLYLFSTMALITLGCGGIKPNIANFGGDQYDVSDPEQVKEQQSFFNYFYLVINVGATVSYGYLVTLATNGQPPVISKRNGFFAAYMIASGCFVLCMFIFVAGTPKYHRLPPGGDSFRGLIYYVWNGAKRTLRGKVALFGWITVFLFLIVAVAQSFITDIVVADALSYLALALASVSCVTLSFAHLSNDYMNGIPDEPSGMLTLEEAQGTFDTIPIVLIVNIAFNICYNQMSGSFQAQACQMNLSVAGGGQINGAFFNIGDSFAIIAFTPFFESFFLPLCAKLKGSPVTGMQQLILGLFVAALSMFVAAGLEYARRAAPVMWDSPVSNCAPTGVHMSDISGFLMFVPFALIGVAEVLINPYMYYFVYTQTPPRARSLSQ
eukprot:Ihof_evm9s178 gene=Ihof_evmTU9s178